MIPSHTSRFRAAWLIALLLLVSSSILARTSAAVEIQKSPNDDRSYEYLVLENGLRALLISDPDTDKAAASLDVHVGNGSDPKGREGLAHFLEHMLFLGTEKYPEPGEYKDFISGHGGGQNAYTSFDHTNYFFDIDKDYLEPALDRFSQFFVAPLFNERYVTRERQVVNSEFLSGRKSDSRRVFAAGKQALNSSHPLSSFSVGTEQTLADRPDSPVREDLIAFYERHYSAGLMTLAVLGKEPLAALRLWVEEKFSGVPNTGAEALRISEPLYPEGRLPARLDVVPIKDQRSLSLTFPIPSVAAYYRTKPVSYIAHLLGHEGAGSLLSHLRERGWADELSAGTGFDHSAEATFNVSLKLTARGLEHVDDISGLVFQYLELIDRQGIKSWIYEENRKLAEIDFRFREPPPPLSYVRGLAASMHLYPPEHVLIGPYMFERFDPGLIRGYLKRLTPDNVLLTVVGKNLQTEHTTPMYETEYRLSAIGADKLRRWSPQEISNALAIPEPNVFIPENLAVKPLRDATPVPTRIHERPGLVLWHQQDQTFDTPRANFYVSVRSPLANDRPEHGVLTQLYVSMVNDQLSEFSYPANLAGLNYSLYPHIRGITIRISGYSEKQDVLFRRIVSALSRPELDQRRFEVLKQELIRRIRNRREDAPYDRALNELRDMLIHPQWSDSEQLEAARGATLERLKSFIPRFRRQIQVVMLSHGNVYPSDALRLQSIIEESILKGSTPVEVPHGRLVKLEEGDRFLRELKSSHEESASVIYLQGKDRSLETRATSAVISQILSPAFFEELRTERRLGYIVFASHMTMMEVPGVALVVQSPSAAPDVLSGHMRTFVQGFHEKIAQMSEDGLGRHKSALLSNILEEETQLQERTNRYWNEIDREHYGFDLREQLATAVRAVGLDDIDQLYRVMLLSDARKVVEVRAAGARHAGERSQGQTLAYGEFILVTSPESFKQNRQFFDP